MFTFSLCCIVMCWFFFFKQKTAYEMRISDWSSDVCSSDLHLPVQIGSTNPPHVHLMALARELKAYGFADFVRPFAADAGKAMFAAEWAEWQAHQGCTAGI